MTKFQRSAYAEMKSVDRVLLYLEKIDELMEFQNILTDQDLLLLKRYLNFEEKQAVQE
ncbi:MAG: hypothetical protein VB053_06695 [Oscillibacter ruminantium]|uniref:hypothetical protein n=1 Tax=Oscillibacter ruminantium TaxID=1263547 RepID=UPI002B1F6DCB|nr:hypothetical protein [Oscillibacter ruminantium]MEA5042217.1 hypothetical protein [Oscillibacter ruminantium]